MFRALFPVAVVAAAVTAGACASALRPRTAEVMDPGRAAFSIAANATFGLGYVDLELPEGERKTLKGNSGALGDFPFTLMPAIEMGLRFGIFPRCELGLMFPYLRLGGEIRCAILDERKMSPVSLAGSVGAAYLVWRGGPYVRAGFDVSRRFKTKHPLAPMLNLYVSYGPQGHALGMSSKEVPFAGGAEQAPWAWILRDEVRLEMAVGMSITAKEEHGMKADIFFGVAPHVAVWEGDLVEAACQNCVDVDVRGFREEFGISIVVGGELRGTGDEADRTWRPLTKKKKAKGLLVGGWATFTSLYITGIAAGGAKSAAKEKGAWHYFVPVVGPLLAITDLDFDNERTIIIGGKGASSPEWPILGGIMMTFWSIGQALGLAMAISGHVLTWQIRKEEGAPPAPTFTVDPSSAAVKW